MQFQVILQVTYHFRWNACKAFLHYVLGFDMFVRPFDTKSAPRISREPFDLESTNFILHGHPYRHSLQPHQIWRHYLLPFGSYSEKLSKIQPPTTSFWISQEQFKHRSRNFTHLSRTFGLTNLSEMTPAAASSHHWSKFEKQPKMLHLSALFALSLMHVSQASSNFSSVCEKYRQCFHIKWRGVSPSPTLWRVAC